MRFKSLLLGLVVSVTAFSTGYESHELDIASDLGEPFGTCVLGATLLLPKERSSDSLVVLVHGSGPMDRDGTYLDPTGTYTPYKDIAESLSNGGMATLRFDKRSSIAPCLSAMDNDVTFSPNHFVEDVENLIKFARFYPLTKNLDIVLLGHSQGVNFVAEIAKVDPQIKGLILMAGLGEYAIDETLLRQQKFMLSQAKSPEDKKLWEATIGMTESFFPSIHDGTAKPTDKYFGGYTKFWSDWIEMTERAAEVAAAVKVPSLLLQGDKDWNITQEDFKALEKATASVEKSKAVWFEGLSHFFTSEGKFRVAPQVLSHLNVWVRDL